MSVSTQRSQEQFARALPSIGRYRLVAEIGVGSSAHVYLARASGYSEAGRFFAVKVLRGQLSSRPGERSRFLEEQSLAAKVKHRRVIGVHEVGTDRGRAFAALQYVRGEPLDYVLRTAITQGRPVSLEALAHTFASICEGLEAVHAVGNIVHRALLTKNVLLGFDGVPRLADCGPVRIDGDDTTLEAPPEEVLAASAPEILTGMPLDRRADIFAIGVLLWEATTGARLFRRRKPVDTLRALLEEEIPRPSVVRANYPRALEELIMASLSREPAQRPKSAAELSKALRAFAERQVSELDGSDEMRVVMHDGFGAKLETRLAMERRAIAELRALRGLMPIPVEIIVGDLTVPDLEEPTAREPIDDPAEVGPTVSSHETVDIEAPTRFEIALDGGGGDRAAAARADTELTRFDRRPEIRAIRTIRTVHPIHPAARPSDTLPISLVRDQRRRQRDERRVAFAILALIFGALVLVFGSYFGL